MCEMNLLRERKSVDCVDTVRGNFVKRSDARPEEVTQFTLRNWKHYVDPKQHNIKTLHGAETQKRLLSEQ